MKIVMGVSHYPPTYAAGAELCTERAARWLVDRGHSVEIVCVERIDADQHLSVQRDVQDGVLVHRLGLKLVGMGEHLGLRYRDDALGDWFADYLTRAQPDLFHSQSCYLLTASTIDAARRVGVPTVATLHDYWFLCPRITLLRSNGERCLDPATVADCTWCLMAERRRYRLLGTAAATLGRPRRQGESRRGPFGWPLDDRLLGRLDDRRTYLRRMLQSVDQVIAVAPLIRDLLVADGLSPARVRLIPTGLDVNGWRGVPHTSSHGVLRIGYLGQIAPHKGIHVLVKAFRRLVPGRTVPELHIYGDRTRFPQYGARLEQLAAGHSRIRFHGGYDNRRVEAMLSQLDVIVVPSVWFETGPVVVMEAFAAGVPVVVSRLPNQQYRVRDEVDGLLFSPGDVDDLARQLQRLIDEPALLRRLAEGVAPVHTLEDEMVEIEALYRGVLARTRSAAANCESSAVVGPETGGYS